MSHRWKLLATLILGLLTASTRLAAQTDPLIAQKAIAVLQKSCYGCHGSAQTSGLDMRERESLLKGGSRGAAVVPGHAEKSLLYQAAMQSGDLKMPPGQPRLSDADLNILREWIEAGVPWDTASTGEEKTVTSWWSFQRPQRPPVPAVHDPAWVRNPVDAFILAKLEEKGLKPAPRADKRTLLRRVYFDLIGLPPTPEAVQSFLNDHSPDAYQKVVDRLLDSPSYGERWARHWLDVVRYADSAGYEGDVYYAKAWRYRDYVIKSFNDDKPYDRFLQEQIAGDELWPDNLDLDGTYQIPKEKLEHLEARIGTGLYTLGPQVHESNMDGKKLFNETLTDDADTTGAVFMGVTLGCARCHNHKFDPFTQHDYYSFQAIFANSQEMRIPIVDRMEITDEKHYYPRIIAVEEARTAFRLFEESVKRRLDQSVKNGFPPEAVKAYETPPTERTDHQQQLAEPLQRALSKIQVDRQLMPQESEQRTKLLAQLAEAVLNVPEKITNGLPYDGLLEIPTVAVLGHREPVLVPDVHVLSRGDLGSPKERVSASIPAVFGDDATFSSDLSGTGVPQTRKELALWLTEPDHPLTSRVMVNRIWQWHFGRGIVDTSNDFGRQGQIPTHPELLDWLATEFVAQGWSMKVMHRMLVLSNTYQMASQYQNARNSQVDPDNRYLWRMNRSRLESEALWDAIHSVAGTLSPKMGGRPVTPPLTEEEYTALGTRWAWPVSADPTEANRRGIYILVRRNFSFPMFDAYDRPENAVSCPMRDVTTVAPQALWSFNNQTAFREAEEFAARLIRESGDHPDLWVDRAWKLALSRPPSTEERQEALALLDTLGHDQARPDLWQNAPEALRTIPLSRAAALTKLCLAVFNLSEFQYID